MAPIFPRRLRRVLRFYAIAFITISLLSRRAWIRLANRSSTSFLSLCLAAVGKPKIPRFQPRSAVERYQRGFQNRYGDTYIGDKWCGLLLSTKRAPPTMPWAWMPASLTASPLPRPLPGSVMGLHSGDLVCHPGAGRHRRTVGGPQDHARPHRQGGLRGRASSLIDGNSLNRVRENVRANDAVHFAAFIRLPVTARLQLHKPQDLLSPPVVPPWLPALLSA